MYLSVQNEKAQKRANAIIREEKTCQNRGKVLRGTFNLNRHLKTCSKDIVRPKSSSGLGSVSALASASNQPTNTNQYASQSSSQYVCHKCDFSTARQNLIVLHLNYHRDDSQAGVQGMVLASVFEMN